MHLGKEQSTGIAADVDDVAAAAEAATPAPEGGERRCAPAAAPVGEERRYVPSTAERPAGTGAR